MRVVVQRVMQASVSVGSEMISSIGQGICLLVGISRDDTPADMDYMVRKLLNLRVFDDENGKRWAKNVTEKNFEILCVSQFTLYHVLKGNKPDFHNAMGGQDSEQFYNQFLQKMKDGYQADKIKNGQFGAEMQVTIQNDGPVTLTLDSPQQPLPKQRKQQQPAKKPVQNSEVSSSSSVDKLTDELGNLTT